MDSASSRRVDRVDLACVQCRSRHVKCDATQPICNRCRHAGKDCTYRKSRRGGLDKAALARRRLRLRQEAELAKQKQSDPHEEHHSSTQSSSSSSPMDTLSNSCIGMEALSVADMQIPGSSGLTFNASDDRLLELFFSHFWFSIPIVMPLHFLQMRKTVQNNGMTELLLVLQYIGSMYAPWAPSEFYYEVALVALHAPHMLRSPFNVQALMLFAIAQHFQCFRAESRVSINLAIEIALELRMSEKRFAQAYGEGDPVLEECWRRTWYCLHVYDQLFSVAENTPIYILSSIPGTVDLPCDDEFFENGNIPLPATWQEYENREFADVEVIYSSIVYLYDISRTVLYVMNQYVLTGTLGEALISGCDTKVAVWQSLLPAVKRDPMRKDGTVDEMMFMAHVTASVILLTMHRPLSALRVSKEEFMTRSPGSRSLRMPPSANAGRGAHTARALKAIEMHTKLLAIPCDVLRHNLFLVNITAQMTNASVSACDNLLKDHALAIARDRVRLGIGVLNTMGSVWKLAKEVAKDVRHVARSTLGGGQNTHQTVEPGLTDEIELLRDEVIWPSYPSAHIDIYSGLELPGNWGGSSDGQTDQDLTVQWVFGQERRIF